MNEEKIYTIDVFANSGHHYTFIPLPEKVIAEVPKLRKLCARERSRWFELNHQWIRGRFGVDAEKNPGIWVVVESNLGIVKRGSIYSAEHQVPESGLPGKDPEEWKKSPYPYPSETKLPKDDSAEPITIEIPHPDDKSKKIGVAKFRVIWKIPNGEPIDVDLVVDFGNTRTVVLALENRTAQEGKLAAVCHPVRFIRRGKEYERPLRRYESDGSVIVDSWFVLHESTFAEHDPPSPRFTPVREYLVEENLKGTLITKRVERVVKVAERVPQMFVELSPCVMGDEARDILGNIDLDQGGNYSLSSPKRYTWDSEPVGRMGSGYWTMVLNRWNPQSKNQAKLPVLNGSMLRFLYEDGHHWDIEHPPNEEIDTARRPISNPAQPAYPRKDAMCWAALSILELAYRQITSSEWRKGNDPFLPRRIRNILVTFPSGWIADEAKTYADMWQKAINIFSLSHFENVATITNGGMRPVLEMELDEAVASQLPLVYSEIRRMGNIGENWIELYGKGLGDDAHVRIMTIDIGGGTTDISVVDYWDDLPGAGVALKYRPIFKDSNSYAGDRLAKEIIERVLLPALASAKGIDCEHEEAETFEGVFRAAYTRLADKAKWSRIVKLVFLPIIRQWLSDLTAERYGNPATGAPWAPDELEGSEGKIVDASAFSDLNTFFEEAGLGKNFVDPLTPIKYDPAITKECIRDSLSPGLEPLAKFVTSFDVDLVSLSGKPSELPQVKELLDEILPILPQRIVPLRQYAAGDWYPMSANQRISDAKTVTAVGAALYSAIRHGLIDGWTITKDDTMHEEARNFWGLMPSDSEATGFGADVYLKDTDERATVRLLVNSYIGRMRYMTNASRPEQQYKLVWSDPELWQKRNVGAMLEVELVRDIDLETGKEVGLKLGEQIRSLDGEVEVTREDVELQLCTLEGGEFWIDAGRFEVQWQ